MHRLDVRGAGNALLDALPSLEAERLCAVSERVTLSGKCVLYAPDRPIAAVYLLTSGVVSIVATLRSGHSAEIGIVGREGAVGIPLVADIVSSPHEAIVLVPGSALKIPAPAFKLTLDSCFEFRKSMLRCLQTSYSQVAQIAVCNGHHTLRQRLAKWLMLVHDRIEGDELDITHEFLSTMVGSHRPGVSIAAGNLQREGMIEYRRGRLRIVDRDRLAEAACECYIATQQKSAPSAYAAAI
jgi:CRP-like cAMP-binding protein